MLPAGQTDELGSKGTYTVLGITYDSATGMAINAPMSINHSESVEEPLSDTSGEPPESSKDDTKFTGEFKEGSVRNKFSDRKGGGGLLRYPYEAMDSTQDFIKFDILEYKRRPIGQFDKETRRFAKGSGFVGGPDRNVKVTRSITLPIPSQISDTNSVEYGSGNLNFLQEFGLNAATGAITAKNFQDFYIKALNAAEGGLNVLGDNQDLLQKYFAMQAVNAFGGNLSMDQLLARSSGKVINPNMELLFQAPQLRQFKFSFKLTPRFEKEGEEVRKIIRAFKYHSSPKGSGQDFLKTPDIFQLTYMSGKDKHKFLNRFKLCALTNMSVNYTGDGTYATYDDQTPVSMVMDLSFQELTPVYAEDYEEQRGTGGVGY